MFMCRYDANIQCIDGLDCAECVYSPSYHQGYEKGFKAGMKTAQLIILKKKGKADGEEKVMDALDDILKEMKEIYEFLNRKE